MNAPVAQAFPCIHRLGVNGLVVQFDDKLSLQANRAALALRAQIDDAHWPEVDETATALASVYLRFDPLSVDVPSLTTRLRDLLRAQDWAQAPLPPGGRLWTIPCVFNGKQLNEAARMAGVSPERAVEDLSSQSLRVLTIGFGPGQPYLGELPAHWDLPRQKDLTPQVPSGALVVAIRQLVLFSAAAPTGWWHVGQTAFRCFRPDHPDPMPLKPGDDCRFVSVSESTLSDIRNNDASGAGGARSEARA